MIKKYRIDGLWIAGMVFGLVLPLPVTLLYSAYAAAFLVPGLLATGFTLPERLFAAMILLWPSAGWVGLASIFSILKRSDYFSQVLNLRQVIGLILGIVAATPWIFIGFEFFKQSGTFELFDLLLFSLAGPIIVATVCLVKLKWQIRKNQADAGQPSSANGT